MNDKIGPPPFQHQLRTELELMALGDLLEPAGGEGVGRIERTVQDRYLVSGLAQRSASGVAAYGWTDLNLGHGFHETKQGVRYTISEPARREVLQRLLKLNHERHAEEVRQGLHEKKRGGGVTRSSMKKRDKPNVGGGAMLFDWSRPVSFRCFATNSRYCLPEVQT